MIRQPIVTVCGHVDHGKTTLLDKIIGINIAEKEAGRITQKISFVSFPAENIKKGCYLIDKYSIPLKIPGFLFIDTPGHQAFTNLRKRGGSLADLAILVIDINEGIMPQTAEVLSILRQNKTPFIIALNKVDRISGWQQMDADMKTNIERQPLNPKQEFDEKFYRIVAALDSHGFKSDLFFNVKDFTRELAIVPCSAKTMEGIPELLMVLCGVSQKFLEKQLNLGERAKGVIFELNKERTMSYIEAIIYDGKLKQGDEIAIGTFSAPLVTKIRFLEEVTPLSKKFKPAKEVTAATGIRMQITGEAKDVLPGMPFQILKGDIEEIDKEFKKEIGETVKTDSEGIIVKAESLGSLEALLFLLKQQHVKVLHAGIGDINKKDIVAAKTNDEINPLYSVILGFNVALDEEAGKIKGNIKILTDEVVYKLIENVIEWQGNKLKEIEKAKLLELASIFKLEILPKYVFRNSKPAIFGVSILAGKLKPNIEMIDNDGEEIGRAKNIQVESKSMDEAEKGTEVAISLPGVTFDRQLKDKKILYSDLSERQFKKFKEHKDLLSQDEIKAIQEIAEIKRRKKATWGV